MKRHPFARHIAMYYWSIHKDHERLRELRNSEAGLELLLELTPDLQPLITHPDILEVYQKQTVSSIYWRLADIRSSRRAYQHFIKQDRERIAWIPLG